MKNIVLIITDTFRYDNLGDKAERPVQTPHLDRFARDRATAIDGCYTGSFPTIPHRTDVVSGVLGWPHYGWQHIDNSGPNHAAALLSKAGYATQLICDCPHLFNAGFQRAFHGSFQLRGQEGDKPLLHLNDPIERVMSVDKTRYLPMFRGNHTLADCHQWINRYWTCEDDTFPPRTAGTTVKWLEENFRAGPFFLWVDFFDPHEPWDPPEYMVRRYDGSEYAGDPMIHPNYGPVSDYTDAELHNLWAHYAAESELVDRWIGRVLQKIDDLQLWDDTVVIVTADHGTSVGEHSRTGKTNIHKTDPRFWPIYPEICHVPLFFAGGGVPAGATIDMIVQPVDILPTAYGLAGVSVSPEQPLDGTSFAEQVLSSAGTGRDLAVSASFIEPKDGEFPRKAATPFVIRDTWGYAPIGASGVPELYDLGTDPMATRDLISENSGVAEELNSAFADHLRRHGAGDADISFWLDALSASASGDLRVE